MVDRLRAYRRWRSRKLGLLLPVFVAALATQLWLVAGSSAPAWLRVVSIGTSALVLALIGYFLAQILLCSRLQTRGNRTGARVLREHLAPSGPAALVAASLLAIMNTVPYLIPPDPTTVPALPSAGRMHFPASARPPIVAPGIEVEIGSPMEAASPAVSRPDVRPAQEGLPLSLSIDDPVDPASYLTAMALLGHLPREPEATLPENDPDGFPRYRPDVQDGFQLIAEDRAAIAFERLGVPREGNPEDWLPPEMRLEVSFLNGREKGMEFSIHVDLPIGPKESIRTTIALGRLPGNVYTEESVAESWQRVTIAYSYRVTGYTRQAPFDLSFSIGISADRFVLEGSEGLMSEGGRLSPILAVDATLWQNSTAGLMLHAAYSLPVNVTGASSAILDLSAIVKFDLTDHFSIHAGYRYLVLRLRDYENALIGSESGTALGEEFSGPILGLDVRF